LMTCVNTDPNKCEQQACTRCQASSCLQPPFCTAGERTG
jgi:hypothetical protein